jgi:hypothetical protein
MLLRLRDEATVVKMPNDPTDPEEIRASLAEHQKVTDEMLSILSSFDERLLWLEKSTIPIHNVTQNLTRAQNNIDTALVEIEKVNCNLRVVEEVDLDQLKKTLVDSSDITAFLDGVEKLNDAKLFLQSKGSFKSTSSALTEIDAQLRKAMTDSQMEFGRLIGKYNMADGSKRSAQGGSWGLDDQEMVTKVQQLCECMESCGHDGYITAYAEQRSAAFVAALVEHKRVVEEETHYSSTPFTGAAAAAQEFEPEESEDQPDAGGIDGDMSGSACGVGELAEITPGVLSGCAPVQKKSPARMRAKSITGSMRGRIRTPTKRSSMQPLPNPTTASPGSLLVTPTPKKKRHSLAVIGGQMLLGKGRKLAKDEGGHYGMGFGASSSYMRGAHPFVHFLRYFTRMVHAEYILAEDLLTCTGTGQALTSGVQSHSHTDTRYMVGQRHTALVMLVTAPVEAVCREGARAISSVKAAIAHDLRSLNTDGSAAGDDGGAGRESHAAMGGVSSHGGRHAAAGVLAALDLARSVERALPRLTHKLQVLRGDEAAMDRGDEGGDGGRSKEAGRGGQRRAKRSSQLSQIEGLHSTLMETATQALHQYLVLIATGVSSTTADGTVHPLTSSTIRLLQDMLRFRFEPTIDALCQLERSHLSSGTTTGERSLVLII